MKIQIEGNKYVVSEYDAKRWLSKLRALPAREWKGDRQVWLIPICKESFRAMRSAGFPLDGLTLPSRSGYRIERGPSGNLLILRTLGTPQDIQLSKRIPESRSYSQQHGGWLFKPTRANVQYLNRAFPGIEWDGSAEHLIGVQKEVDSEEVRRHAARLALAVAENVDDKVTDYKYRTTPYDHQDEAFRISRKQPVFALLMQQGTGKTKVTVDTAAYNFQQGTITGMLVLCPNGVKDTWLEELETHLPEDVTLDVFVWGAKTRHKAKDWILRAEPGERPFRVFIMNIEALSGEIGGPIAELFLARHTSLMVVDEFTRIKSPSAGRTKNALKLAKKAPMRRILSGTVITQAPLDIFCPFKFLDPQILGFSSIYSMRNRHATLGGFQGRQIIGYVKVEELAEKIKPVSYRKLRSECLDLPGKIYEKITVELNTKQRELYNQMASELKATVDWINPDAPTDIEVVHAITKIMRLQQIVGGFIPMEISGTKVPLAIPGDNPKMVALMDALDDIPKDEKIVVWAHFHPELELLTSTLRKEFGQKSVTEFSGRVADDIRQAGRRDFQLNTSGARFFIGQEQAGGMGITLTASHLTYYYSNGQSLENRLQSEDRQDRIGQTEQVVVTDIVAKNSSDSRIVSGYRSKKRLADLVTGDPTLSWL